MKLSDKLLVIASWLEDAENELLVSAEDNEECLNKLAETLVAAASVLKAGAEEVSQIEPAEEITLTPEKLEEIAAVAQAFDESGDELLIKQASVLDEILLTIGAPKGFIFDFKKAEDQKIDTLKKKYKDPKKELDDVNKVADTLKALEKSPAYKKYRPLEAPLSTRTCPDHPGAQMGRIAENTWQCSMDSKVYNYETGYTTLKGNVVPGGSVDEQTPSHIEQPHMTFDTRESKLGLNNIR